MCRVFVGLVLFIGSPAVFQAVGAAQSCPAPSLDGGFLVTAKETYADGETLHYGCDEGLKPAVEGWWATSTCENGQWSHAPKCIDEKACLPPTVPNGKYAVKRNGWHRENSKVWVTCDAGYEKTGTAGVCVSGTWVSLPVCQKSAYACSQPPKINNGLIIHKTPKEVFAANEVVQYVCRDGYTTEEGHSKTAITCSYGTWTEASACRRQREGGRAAQRAPGDRGSRTEQDGSTHDAGSPATSGSADRDSPLITTISRCGAHPMILNGDVVEETSTSLKYQCNSFYALNGSETVVCYNDGTWSPLPVCEEAFCNFDPDEYTGSNLNLPAAVRQLKNNEQLYISCKWSGYYSLAQCTNKVITFSDCCVWDDFYRGACP